MASNNIDLKYVVDSTQLKEANQELNRTGNALKNTATLANSSGKKMNKFGVAMQQTGYQVGDFLVQVQSGQNALVAFGQQATQLVGILPMFNSFMGLSGSALIGLSAGLGIAIPLFTAIAAAIVRTSKDAKGLAKEFEGLKEALKDYEAISKIASDSTKELGKGFENLSRESKFAIKELQALKLMKLDEEFDKIANAITDVSEISGRLQHHIARNYREFLGLKRITSESIPEIINLQKALEKAVSIEDKTQAAVGLAQAISRITGGVDKMTEEQKIYYETVLNSAKELASLSESNNQAELKRLREMSSQELALGEKLQEGLRQKALETHEAEQRAIAQTAEYIKDMEGVFNAAQKRMRDEEIARTEDSLSRLFRARTVSYRIRFAGDESVMGQSLSPSGGRMNLGMTRQELLDSGISEANLKNFIIKPDPKGSGSGSGGGSKSDPLAQLRKQLELERQLVGVSEERERVIRALGLNFVRNNPQIAEGLQNQIARTKELIEVENERLNIIETIDDSMSRGLMSMVDGTKSVKEAFRDMARSIIRQLYEIYVVQTLIKSFTRPLFGLLGFKDGGAFSNGTQIKAFADGGVVSGPTTFPMSGGKTGLMGEAGPEAIMPLKRGSDGKLGVYVQGGSSKEAPVVINQTFNFQANGDESVKKLIAQAAPKISDMAKNSVLDARRRGGQMKSTFR